LFCVDNRFHAREHAIEVELPLIQQAYPGTPILPIEVPAIESAVEIGRAVARQVANTRLSAVFLASSDLTHYGPAYRFAPAGVGLAALEWARSNDHLLLELVERFQPEEIVAETTEHLNACGGGAIAAMMAACRDFGASSARLLRHTTSYETLAEVAPQQPDNSVGYASVVVG
jgi:AmmeMemoRadiSam system protein B